MKKRIQQINSLIKLISEQDNGFFRRKEGKCLANFKLKDNKLFYQDERKGEEREITKRTKWTNLYKWVCHGSTLCTQIIEFAQFIFTGKPQQLVSRYWGISHKSQRVIHQKAFDIEFIDYKEFTFHDYDKKKDITQKVKNTQRREYNAKRR